MTTTEALREGKQDYECCFCHEVKPLNASYFYEHKDWPGLFAENCIECSRKIKNENKTRD